MQVVEFSIFGVEAHLNFGGEVEANFNFGFEATDTFFNIFLYFSM